MVAISSDDWRRQGQEKFMKAQTLRWQQYIAYRPSWDHDHCEFCGTKLSNGEGDLHEGYVTQDRYHWVCEKCFKDFREEFDWRVEG